jgi:hypothetical protein
VAQAGEHLLCNWEALSYNLCPQNKQPTSLFYASRLYYVSHLEGNPINKFPTRQSPYLGSTNHFPHTAGCRILGVHIFLGGRSTVFLFFVFCFIKSYKGSIIPFFLTQEEKPKHQNLP